MGTKGVGSASPASVASTPSLPADVGTTTVQKGERTFLEIARRLGLSAHALRDANPGIHFPLKAGTELKLPKALATGTAATAGSAEVVSSGASAAATGQAEKAKAASLHAEVATGTGLQASTGTLKPGDKGQEIEQLQKDINAWRAAQNPPLDPIPVTGKYDEATKKKVKEFEAAYGLKADGKADVVVRDLLTIRQDPDFQRLDAKAKDDVASLLTTLKDYPERRKGVMEVATNPSFTKLDSDERQEVLERLKGGRSTELLATQMKDLEELKSDKSFASLDSKVRVGTAQVIFSFGGPQTDAQKEFVKMMKADAFAKLPAEVQYEALGAFYEARKLDWKENKSESSRESAVSSLVLSGPFAKLSEEKQKDLLGWIQKHPDPLFIAELDKLGRKDLAALDDNGVKSILVRLGIVDVKE